MVSGAAPPMDTLVEEGIGAAPPMDTPVEGVIGAAPPMDTMVEGVIGAAPRWAPLAGGVIGAAPPMDTLMQGGIGAAPPMGTTGGRCRGSSGWWLRGVVLYNFPSSASIRLRSALSSLICCQCTVLLETCLSCVNCAFSCVLAG